MRYAVLVLEQPWWSITQDPEQTSVRHFLNGLARLHGLPIFYSTFFDANSFDQALRHLLEARKLEDIERLIVYVASHGSGGRLGGEHGQAMNLRTVFDRIQEHGKGKVAGLILDSCEVGGEYCIIEEGMARAKLSWVVAYSASVDWLASMLINLHVLATLTCLEPAELKQRDALLASMQEAFAIFNPTLDIDGDETFLAEALTVAIRTPKSTPEILAPEDIWPDLREEEDD